MERKLSGCGSQANATTSFQNRNKCIFWKKITRNPSLLLLLALALSLFSCKKDNVVPEFPVIKKGEGVFVINEGNFQAGNASLGYYHIESNTMYNNLFNKANQEEMGDVFQSMTVHNQLAYLVLNNSGKIEVVDPYNCKRKHIINGFTSPRYILPVSNTKAYVTDLFANKVSVADLNSNSISSYIPINGWTETMVMHYGSVIIASPGSGFLYRVDPVSDNITDSLYLGGGPSSMVVDAYGHPWILCGSDPFYMSGAKLVKLHSENFEILSSEDLANGYTYYSKLVICPEKKTLYFLGGDVLSYDTSVPNAEIKVLIPSEGRFFYGLNVDPQSGRLLVSDAVDFVQNGVVMVYEPDGYFVQSAPAMVAPSDFYFY